MKSNLAKQKAAMIAVLFLFFSSSAVLSAGTPIIKVTGNQITMSNDVGCKLDFFHENGKYGLGTFYFKDVKLGEPINYFLTEDNIFENSANSTQKLWPGTWRPYFQANKYEIIQNNADTGIIKFMGKMGLLSGSVTITLLGNSSGYKLDYDILVLETIKHSLYVSGPFIPENMQFVKFPFETPLVAPFKGDWSITPTMSMVPLMFGCEKINNKEYFVGVGYQLEKDNYGSGEIKYDAAKTGPFQIYFIPRDNSGWFPGGWSMGDCNIKLHVVISTASNQYDCISGYREMSGFDVSTPIYRPLAESLKGVMDMYENCTAYVSLPPFKNKAYHHQIMASTGKPPVKGYGSMINIGINVQLGYQLYKYWQENPEETWAKERAINTAGFFIESQNEDGSIPGLWAPAENRFRTYRRENTDSGYIYTMERQALGAYNLYRMYLARIESENIAVEEWKQSALKAIDYIAAKVQPNGFLGRTYNKEGNYDSGSAQAEALIALDYFYVQTGDKKYEVAREKLENYTYNFYARTNHWSDWGSDWGGWDGNGPPPWDNDALNIQNFATYCAYRHDRTGEQKYIDWAKNALSYNWLATIPIQYPGFKNVTKGLAREQDYYLTYDIPYRGTILIDCYPYLSMVTGDRFFIDYYKMLIQTQHFYQHPADKGFQAFDIGLWWDSTGANPRDEIGEPDINYIVEFCSLYLESVTSPNAYRYVGGQDWGVGLDYDLAFKPDFKKGEPYVASSSTNVTSAKWDSKTKTLSVALLGEVGKKGILNIKWIADKDLAKSCKVEINGEKVDKKSLYYNTGQNILKVNYGHKQKVLTIQISAQ